MSLDWNKLGGTDCASKCFEDGDIDIPDDGEVDWSELLSNAGTKVVEITQCLLKCTQTNGALNDQVYTY